MYALNLADLTKYTDNLAVMLLVTPVMSKQHLAVDKQRIDSEAVLLDCDNDRADAIVQVLRLRLKKHELRAYHRENGRWHTI